MHHRTSKIILKTERKKEKKVLHQYVYSVHFTQVYWKYKLENILLIISISITILTPIFLISSSLKVRGAKNKQDLRFIFLKGQRIVKREMVIYKII